MRYWVHVRLTAEPVDAGPDYNRMSARILEMLEDVQHRTNHDREFDVSAVYVTPPGFGWWHRGHVERERDAEEALADAWRNLGRMRLTAFGLRRARMFMSRGGPSVMTQMHSADELGKNFTVLSNLPVIVGSDQRVLCIPHLGYFNQRVLQGMIPPGLNLVVNLVPHMRSPNQTGVAANPLTYTDARFSIGVQSDLSSGEY